MTERKICLERKVCLTSEYVVVPPREQKKPLLVVGSGRAGEVIILEM